MDSVNSIVPLDLRPPPFVVHVISSAFHPFSLSSRLSLITSSPRSSPSSSSRTRPVVDGGISITLPGRRKIGLGAPPSVAVAREAGRGEGGRDSNRAFPLQPSFLCVGRQSLACRRPFPCLSSRQIGFRPVESILPRWDGREAPRTYTSSVLSLPLVAPRVLFLSPPSPHRSSSSSSRRRPLSLSPLPTSAPPSAALVEFSLSMDRWLVKRNARAVRASHIIPPIETSVEGMLQMPALA
ncbi:hypothetical protein B0H19DRAFT_1255283 [Mycena capillaripes]|nr:hypothetical protein B0H19DRAFT_1255283 [Mycena capillaripes]